MQHVQAGVVISTRYRAEHYQHFHTDGSRCYTPRDLCGRLHVARLAWASEFDNIVVTTGLNRLLSATLKGSAVGGPAAGYHDGLRMPTKWVLSTAYSVGDVVRPTNASGQIDNNRIFVCEVAGTSNSTEPTWSNTPGASVTDNTVTWREMSVWFCGLKNTGSMVAADTMASHGGWTENTTYSNSTRPIITLGTVSAGSVDNSASPAVFNINGTTTIFGAFACNLAVKGGTAGLLYGGGDFGASRSVISGDTLNVTLTASVS